MIDPYPLMTVHYAIAALRARFGCDRVTCDSHEIAIRLPEDHTKGTLVILTAEQAKYLVAHPISSEDLVNEKYPADWPHSTGGPKRLPPSRPVHGEIAPVAFGPDTALALPRPRL